MRKRRLFGSLFAGLCLVIAYIIYTNIGYDEFQRGFPSGYHGPRRYYVLQNDILVTERFLRRHYHRQRRRHVLELLGWVPLGPTLKEALTPRSEDSTWHTFPITFTIEPQGFSAQQLSAITESFRDATKDWEDICGVSFRYIAVGTESDVNVDFVVVCGTPDEASAARFVSTAFVGPSDDDRKIRVFSTFFENIVSQRGAFRHEIGHVLGFVHEHNDVFAPSDCPRDDPLPQSHNLTPYDRHSVMHYVCGLNGGSVEFGFTDSDIIGARVKYPANE